jgi:uncharacterized repeat protein (TIGR03803 family)
MERSARGVIAVGAAVLVLLTGLLAGCTRENALTALPSEATNARVALPASFRVIHNFQGRVNGDGAHPLARLVELHGNLYGTTDKGGAHDRGSVYVIHADGTEKLLYSFSDASGEGYYPAAGLTAHGGALYGTTSQGGSAGRGTLFTIRPDGALTIIHNFRQETGAYPHADLIILFGVFYGTTESGGAHNKGTVFTVSTTGHYQVLHSFAGGSDGARPEAALEFANGKLYGTTVDGGSHDKGTVYEIGTDGSERVLYSFQGFNANDDGQYPQSKLTALHHLLYGTTASGGNCCGTIFEVNENGDERVLHRLTHGDGSSPLAGLTLLNGVLYGTASRGAKQHGTIFEFMPGGAFKVLHTFGIKDGSEPRAGLITVNGKLYGTTYNGGTKGKGVAFEVTP